MFLHLGQGVVVQTEDIIAVIDMDTSTSSKHTKSFLTRAEKAGQLLVITEEIPKSAVICQNEGGQTVYISQISSKTLLKRAELGNDAFAG